MIAIIVAVISMVADSVTACANDLSLKYLSRNDCLAARGRVNLFGLCVCKTPRIAKDLARVGGFEFAYEVPLRASEGTCSDKIKKIEAMDNLCQSYGGKYSDNDAFTDPFCTFRNFAGIRLKKWSAEDPELPNAMIAAKNAPNRYQQLIDKCKSSSGIPSFDNPNRCYCFSKGWAGDAWGWVNDFTKTTCAEIIEKRNGDCISIGGIYDKNYDQCKCSETELRQSVRIDPSTGIRLTCKEIAALEQAEKKEIERFREEMKRSVAEARRAECAKRGATWEKFFTSDFDGACTCNPKDPILEFDLLKGPSCTELVAAHSERCAQYGGKLNGGSCVCPNGLALLLNRKGERIDSCQRRIDACRARGAVMMHDVRFRPISASGYACACPKTGKAIDWTKPGECCLRDGAACDQVQVSPNVNHFSHPFDFFEIAMRLKRAIPADKVTIYEVSEDYSKHFTAGILTAFKKMTGQDTRKFYSVKLNYARGAHRSDASCLIESQSTPTAQATVTECTFLPVKKGAIPFSVPWVIAPRFSAVETKLSTIIGEVDPKDVPPAPPALLQSGEAARSKVPAQ